MYSKLLIVGFVIAFAVSAFAQASTRPPLATGQGCTAAVSIAKRTGSDYVDSQGRTNSIYDISATNVGSCNIYDLGVDISYPSGAVIVQEWNLQPQSVATLITNFGPYLAVGQTFTGAGLIIAFSGSSSAVVDITVYGANCPATCVNQGSTTGSGSASGSTTRSGSGSGSGSASGSTTGSATGSSSTTSSSSTTGSGFTGCPASVDTVLRSSYASGDGSNINYIYDLRVTNLAPYTLSSVDVSYGIENRSVTQQWNLQTTCCTQVASSISFSVNVFNLAPSAVFSGAGFIQTLPTGTPYEQPIADVLNPAKNLFCSVSDN